MQGFFIILSLRVQKSGKIEKSQRIWFCLWVQRPRQKGWGKKSPKPHRNHFKCFHIVMEKSPFRIWTYYHREIIISDGDMNEQEVQEWTNRWCKDYTVNPQNIEFILHLVPFSPYSWFISRDSPVLLASWSIKSCLLTFSNRWFLCFCPCVWGVKRSWADLCWCLCLHLNIFDLEPNYMQQPSQLRAVLSLRISWEDAAGSADKRGFSTLKLGGWSATLCSL